MSKAFSIQASLNYPPDVGQVVASRAVSQAGNFDSKVEYEYVFTVEGTQVVDLGSVAKATAIMVEVGADSSDPISLVFNDGAEPIEISPGGFVAISSPTPSVGITALSIVHGDDAKVNVYILE